MAGPADGSTGPDGKADANRRSVRTPALASAYIGTVISHAVTADLDGTDREIFVSRVDGFLIPVTTDKGVTLYLQPCRIDLPDVGGWRPSLDDFTVQTRPAVELAATFSEDADGQLTLATESGALLLGVELEDAINDELPTSGDDLRVVDHDADDEPGVTVDIAGFEIYLGVRALIWISGDVDRTTGFIAGEADFTIDTEVYDDSNPFFDARAAAEEAKHDDSRELIESETVFEFVPLREVPVDCAAIGF